MSDRRVRETRIGLALVAGLGLLVFALLTLGSTGGLDPALEAIAVDEVLAVGDPSLAYGSGELRIVGWYAELAADCTGDDGGADPASAWLQAECPLRVLLPAQPATDVGHDALLAGLRLAAASGRPFPPRATPGGANLQLQPLVFVGAFNDPAAAGCVPERAPRCRATFVVSDYRRLVK